MCFVNDLAGAVRHKQIYLQLSLNLRAIVSQRLVKTVDGQRTPAVEILLGSPRVKDLVHKGEIHELKEAMEKGSTIGMQTFDAALYRLYEAGSITLDEALRNADSANNLRLRIKLAEDPDLEEEQSGGTAFDANGQGEVSNAPDGGAGFSDDDLKLTFD